MIKYISQKGKIQYSKWCRQRDGDNCLYCGKLLDLKYVLDHLNNNRQDNRLENFCLCHQSCNITKAYNLDYQILAQEKLKQNETALFIPVEDNTDDQVSTEIKINQSSSGILEQYVAEKIAVDEQINKDDALYGATYICKKKTGHGSIQCMRNYLRILCCAEGPFMEAFDENHVKIIVKRSGN